MGHYSRGPAQRHEKQTLLYSLYHVATCLLRRRFADLNRRKLRILRMASPAACGRRASNFSKRVSSSGKLPGPSTAKSCPAEDSGTVLVQIPVESLRTPTGNSRV